MAKREHARLIRGNLPEWNAWRRRHPNLRPDLESAKLHGLTLRGANLARANLQEADFSGADLTGADLGGANLSYANFQGAILDNALLPEADLDGAFLSRASLRRADLTGASAFGAEMGEADLTGASLVCAYLEGANLGGARLIDANLRKAVLRDTNLAGAFLVRCNVYGTACWDVNLARSTQEDLCVSPEGMPAVTVDNIEIAQFIYLILNNKKLRAVIDTITSKAVLVLGRFTGERKEVLDGIHKALREEYGLVPILFDFAPSRNRNRTETVQLLASICRFVIADITDARSIPQELSKIIPNFPSVPVQPLILASQREYAMFKDWRQFNNVLPEYRYQDSRGLLSNFNAAVILPIEAWRKESDRAAAKKDLFLRKIQDQQATIQDQQAEIARMKALLDRRVDRMKRQGGKRRGP